MTAGELAVVLAAILCVIGFTALIVVLLRVLDTLRSVRSEMDLLRSETRPLLAELRASSSEARDTIRAARDDLDRFDRVLGSAEAISEAVSGGGRVARAALSAPVIKAAGVATGARRVVSRLRRVEHPESTTLDRQRRVENERR